VKRYCLVLDLKNDEDLIEEYKTWHRRVWPEIIQSIKDSGITCLEIYNFHNRLTMILEADDSFSFEKKEKLDADNLKVQEWESLMWKFQQSIPGSKEGEKWVLMDKIFSL
jgi:L-rhamnose mutarotase